MKNKYIVALLWLIGTMAYIFCLDVSSKKKMREEYQRQIENVRAEYATLDRSIIRDTVTTADHSAYTAKHSDLKEKLDDKHLLNDVGLSPRQIKSIQTTSAMTNVDVTLPQQRDTLPSDSIKIPKTWSYHDEWTDIAISDTMLHVATRDSITTIVYREYKHRFLFWKWGTKSIRVKLINYNPHSTIVYDKYIKTE